MANSTNNTAWQQIQNGIYDTQKLLAAQEDNLSMIKAKQTLEIIIKQLSGRDDDDEQSITDIIDSLYTSNVISYDSFEHYHKIRSIGNKAILENNNEEFNATFACQLLSEEVQTFINEYAPRKTRVTPVVTPIINDNPQKRTSGTSTEGTQRKRVVKKSSKNKKKPTVNTADLTKVIIGFVILIVLILLFRSLVPSKKKTNATNTTTTTTVSSDSTDTSETSAETAPETTASVKYITTARLHVRSSPSLDGDILATLSLGVSVEYAGEHDATWSIINYNGGQAYVATAYIKPVQ